MNVLPKRIAYAAVILTGWITTAYAQVIPPSPNAGAMAKFASTPVNLYTGTPTIQAPLLTLPGRTMSVPVGLGYHASGIKVQEVASSVGLGWALNAGGVITRVVRGLPDDDTNGYSGSNQRGNELKPNVADYTPAYIGGIGSGQWDAEPDLFYFNVMGRTGQFVLDADQQAHLVPHQNVQIQLETDAAGAFESWKVTTEDGIVYHFGTEGLARETTEAQVNRIGQADQVVSYTSSWYLTEASAPNSTDKITFTYESGEETSYTYYNYVEVRAFLDDCSGYDDPNVYNLHTTVTLKPSRRLRQIESTLGSIQFSYQRERDDVNGMALTGIKLLDREDQVKKHIALSYGNFTNCPANYGGTECLRLRLDKIEDLSGEQSLPLYQFSYNEAGQFPPRSANYYDHWGYANDYNGVTPGPKLPATQVNGISYAGINREPSTSYADTYLLNRITHITGGMTEFDYEINTAKDDDGNTRLVGGVRVRSVKQYEAAGAEPTMVKTYDYQGSGQVYGTPVYGKSALLADRRSSDCLDRNTVVIRYAQSLTSLYDLNGTTVGYSRVVEQRSDGSSTKYTFTNFDTHPDALNNVYRVTASATSVIGSRSQTPNNNAFISPYPPTNSVSWQRGQLSQVEYRNQADLPVSSVKYFYLTNTVVNATVRGLKVEEIFYNDYDYFNYHVGQYEVLSQPFFLDYKIEEVYDQNDETKVIATRTDYTYDNTYLQLKRMAVTDSDGTKWLTDYRHATDYIDIMGSRIGNNGSVNWGDNDAEEALCVLGMLFTHQHSRVLETTVRRQRPGVSDLEVVSSEFALFTLADVDVLNKIYPAQTYALTVDQPLADFTPFAITDEGTNGLGVAYDSRYEPVQTFDAYDPRSNLLQQTGRDDVTTSQLYSYGYNLPIAQVVGASTDQVAYTSFEAPDEGPILSLIASKDGNFSWRRSEAILFNEGHTGQRSASGRIEVNGLPPGRYKVSCWAKQKSGNSTTTVYVAESGNAQEAGTDWTYLEWLIDVTNGSSEFVVNSTGNLIDEVRIHPADAQMTTYTYDPLVGITSEADVNSVTTYYEYDDLNRLRLVKDQRMDIRQRYQYVYKTAGE